MNPIQQAVDVLQELHDEGEISPQKLNPALTSLRSLQKEVEGELPEPAFRLKWRNGMYLVDKPSIGDTDVYTADQLRTAVAAALGRGAVPQGCVIVERLSKMAESMEGIDSAQPGYHWRKGWNDALRRAIDYAAPSPEATQPTQAEAASVTTSQTVDDLIAYAAQERERYAKWQQWVERGGYDGDQQAEAPSEREAWRGGSSYEASMLRNLLARIHGDGGHYVEQHGIDKALDDAEMLVAHWREALAAQPAAERVPLTDEAALRVVGNVADVGGGLRILRDTERAHGITATNGKEGGND